MSSAAGPPRDLTRTSWAVLFITAGEDLDERDTGDGEADAAKDGLNQRREDNAQGHAADRPPQGENKPAR
jgi:hypothetical protein